MELNRDPLGLVVPHTGVPKVKGETFGNLTVFFPRAPPPQPPRNSLVSRVGAQEVLCIQVYAEASSP
eukprot:9148613-Pyramimonas_sp.AAC.1